MLNFILVGSKDILSLIYYCPSCLLEGGAYADNYIATSMSVGFDPIDLGINNFPLSKRGMCLVLSFK